MAAYGSLHQIFESPKTPKSFLDTLSSTTSPWNPIKGIHVTTNHDNDTPPPFTEIFGELHFRESSTENNNSSLQLCTEGLGSESYYDLEDDGKVNGNGNRENNVDYDDTEIYDIVKGKDYEEEEEEWGPRKKERREYPPAMTRMSFKSYREEGRFVLEEVRIPRREFLRASREDGRLRLKLVQPEEEEDDEQLDQEVKDI